jgi:uncharacterized protein with GYD domain
MAGIKCGIAEERGTAHSRMGATTPGNNNWHLARRRGGAGMSMYVSLVNWTEQGIKNFRDTKDRAEEFSKLVENSGGRVHEQLWTVGQYDMVCVAEFPDDETAAAALLKVGPAGNIRSSTLRAFSGDEITGIISRAG